MDKQGNILRPITGSGSGLLQSTVMSQEQQQVRQHGVNTPPGLAALQQQQDPDNMSLFSSSQLNPGIIQAPTGSRRKLPDSSMTPTIQEQVDSKQRRMDYSRDLGLSDLAERATSSERQDILINIHLINLKIHDCKPTKALN